MKLEKDKQPLLSPIYSPKPKKLETLKIYIKINLTNDFILSFKFFIRVFFFFLKAN